MAELDIKASFNIDRPEKFKPADIESTLIIHFRPSSAWDGKDYGFDWMRICDFEKVTTPLNARGDKIKYKESISYHYKAGTTDLEANGNEEKGDYPNNPIAFRDLEKVYNYHHLIFKDVVTRGFDNVGFEGYYCSWMSIYPNPDKIVNLSLVAESMSDEKPDSFELEYDKEFFEITLTKEADLKSLAKGETKGFADAITFKCKKEFNKDQIISIYSKKEDKRKLAGKMYIWSNEGAKRKKAKVVSVRVLTKYPTLSTETLPSNDAITLNKDVTSEYLRQALIEFKEDIIIDLDCSDEAFKNLYMSTEGIIGYYFTTATALRNESRNRWDYTYDKAPEGFIRMTDHLRDRLHDQEGNKYDDYLQVFYFDEDGGGAYFKTSKEIVDGVEKNVEKKLLDKHGGYADSNKVVIMFRNPMPFMVAHELGHAFSLPHTFSSKAASSNAKFTYKAKTTDVIMDYSHNASPRITMNCFFYWQWKIMNKSILQDGGINK